MKYAVEMGSGVMIYVCVYIYIYLKPHKDWSSHLKVRKGEYTDTQTVRRSHKPTFISFKTSEVG
jgi:hypothetical protein